MPPSGGRENRAASLPRINFQCFQTLEEDGHNEHTIALGRKNWLFAGSDGGGEAAAVFYTLIETAKSNGHNPRLWLTRVLEVIGRDRESTDHDTLLPWTMPPEPATS